MRGMETKKETVDAFWEEYGQALYPLGLVENDLLKRKDKELLKVFANEMFDSAFRAIREIGNS